MSSIYRFSIRSHRHLGTGLSMWRLGDLAQAGAVLRRLLWLNPRDNQGAHLRLAHVESGRAWSECDGAGG